MVSNFPNIGRHGPLVARMSHNHGYVAAYAGVTLATRTP